MTTLGRGLDALIPKKQPAKKTPQQQTAPERAQKEIREIPLDNIRANRKQPRQDFDERGLQELADSIRIHGILQPLIVTKDGETYELIAGERRLRASRIAGLATVPVIVRDAKDQERFELALIENIQRVDLNPIDRARAITALMDAFGMKQEEVAARLGKPQSVISNTVRLLSLPADIQEALARGTINEGHAKILAGIKDTSVQHDVFEKVAMHRLTVLETDAMVKKAVPVRSYVRHQKEAGPFDDVVRRLQESLGTKVSIQKIGDGGKVVIDFYSTEELRGLVDRLTKE